MAARLVPLGGVGEFGANALLVEHENGEAILVDVGVAFSDLEPFGVAYEVPDFDALRHVSIQALLVTHGHDDHARGLEDAVQAFPGVPVAASRATLARLRRAEGVPGEVQWLELGGDRQLPAAGFRVEVAPVSHSIPGTVVSRLRGESGTLVVASDFRLAPSALGETTPLDTLRGWGDAGVDVLLLDATNALVPGPLVPEATVAAAIEEEVAHARGAVVGVTFASHAGRFRQLARAALACGRTVVPVGRGLEETLAVQAELGGLDLPPGAVRPPRALTRLPHEQLLLVATGSQGEPGSGLARVAGDAVPGFRLAPGDVVLHCARVIPGNERRLADLFDHCARRGARVITAEERPIHVSGHPPRDELECVLRALRPRVVVPVHGRRRQLEALAELARGAGFGAQVVENGAELLWRGGTVAPSGVHRGIGRLLVGEGDGAVLDPVTLRQRRSVAAGGLVVATLAVGTAASAGVGRPRVQGFGVEVPPEVRRAVERELAEAVQHSVGTGTIDAEALRSTMSRRLRRELRRRLGRRPSTLVVVSEC